MRRVVDHLVADRTVMAVIVLNTVALFLHEMADRGTPQRVFWYWVDYACVLFFLVEAGLKIRIDGWSVYWRSWWNRFDFTIVVVSLPALLSPVLDSREFAFILVLRLGRLFRLFRVLRFIPNLEHLALGIRRALRASVGVFLALFLIILILSVGATLLFRDIDPERFGNPVVASYSIFKVFTVEGWYEIPEQLEERALHHAEVENHRTFSIAVRLFFIGAVFVGGILGLSLANAVFVDEMIMDNTVELERKVDALADEIRSLRRELAHHLSSPRDRPSRQ
jgi:voltage-gated sodium channel